MTAEMIRQFVKQQPFRPFKINLNDGRSLLVQHPDFVGLPPGWNTMAIIFFPDQRFEFIYLRNIAGVESTGEAPSMPDRRRRDDEADELS